MTRLRTFAGRRKCLYVMRDDCVGIDGMEREEAEALIAALADHIVKPVFVYRHKWQPGDLLLWDNCTVQHRIGQCKTTTCRSVD